jgi:hypothetical protein
MNYYHFCFDFFYERSMMVTRGENTELVGNDPYHFYFYRNHTRYQSTMLIKCQLHARHDYDYDMRTPLFAAYFIYRLTITLLEYYCFFPQQPRKKSLSIASSVWEKYYYLILLVV